MKAIDSVSRDINIIIVDDQALTRSMVKSILKGLGFEAVAMVDSAAAALDRIGRQHFDLIIADWNMPSVTGLDLLRAVRQQEKTKNMRFVMLTAEAYRENVKAAIAAGVTEYVAKPFTPETLAEKIGLAFQSKRPPAAQV